MPERTAKKGPRSGKGFRRASGLLQKQIRTVGESRGFSMSKVLTHWAEIAGEDLAACTRPVDIRFGRSGLGATLTILTTGANAPIVEMRKERLRERVNACYGYAAVSAIRITQTAPTGFSEGQTAFTPAPKVEAPANARAVAEAEQTVAEVADDGLRLALAALGAHILTRKPN